MAKLYQIANASQKMLNDQARFDPICKQGRECVGWGVDGYTGKPTRFPIVRLTYDPSRTDKRFNGLSEPLEVVANRIVNPVWASVDGVQAFPRIEDFVQHVNTQYAGATPSPKGTSGVYSMGFTQVFKEFFQKDDDRALSVTRASKTLISMSLPVDPVTHTRKYDFDRHARDFAESLPPLYDTEDNKAQYRYFLENYGTSFVTSASLGGLVESYASWKSWITDSRLGGFTNAMLERNAQVDFVSKTGLPGPTSAHDSGYVRNRVLQPLFCRGGDSSKSCDASFSKWEKTIADSPVLLDYELAPVSDLVTDPTVKASLDQAVKEYISEKRSEWEKLDKCPVNCGPKGAGSCEKGESTCSCKYKGMIGRMCSGCAPMSVKATFTDILGKKSSAVGTVGCDGKAVTVWQGKGLCRSGALFRRSCSADVQAQCSRSSNGNLMAIVKQQDCNAPCNPSDLQSGFNDKQAQPPLVDRRLLSKRTLSGGSCFPPQLKCKGGKGSNGNSGSSVSTSSASVSVDIQKVKNSNERCSVLDKKKKTTVACQASVTCKFN